MYIERHKLVVPAGMAVRDTLAATSGDDSRLEVYSSTTAVKKYHVSAEGSDSWTSGSVSGTLTTYDYKALYRVYLLDSDVAARDWFMRYHSDPRDEQLKLASEHAETFTTAYELDFEIEGTSYGIDDVFLTFEVIRLQLDGVSQQYVVVNAASAGANSSDGSSYEGGFRAA